MVLTDTLSPGDPHSWISGIEGVRNSLIYKLDYLLHKIHRQLTLDHGSLSSEQPRGNPLYPIP